MVCIVNNSYTILIQFVYNSYTILIQCIFKINYYLTLARAVGAEAVWPVTITRFAVSIVDAFFTIL